MGLFKTAALFAAAILVLATNGNAKELCSGFLPPNDMKIPVGDHSIVGIKNNGGITEAQFNMVMDRIAAIYTDKIRAKGGTLVINRLWSDETVNASAEQQGCNDYAD